MKKATIIVLAIFAVLLAALNSGCSGTHVSEGSYPELVAWNYKVYGLSVEILPLEKIDTEIGQVTRNTLSDLRRNGDSNAVAIGSRLYKIKDISVLDAIAVSLDGTYYKAYTLTSVTNQ